MRAISILYVTIVWRAAPNEGSVCARNAIRTAPMPNWSVDCVSTSRRSDSIVKSRKLRVDPISLATEKLSGRLTNSARIPKHSASRPDMPATCPTVAPRLRRIATSLRCRDTAKPTTRLINASNRPMIGTLNAYSSVVSRPLAR